MDLKKIQDELQNYLKEKNLRLYSFNYQSKDRILEIVLDEKLDLEKVETVSNEISTFMDQFEALLPDNYLLDVSTVGIEREIRNQQELLEAVGNYIYVGLKEEEYYGDLLDLNDGVATLQVKDKTKTKQVKLNSSDIKKMHYAYKF